MVWKILADIVMGLHLLLMVLALVYVVLLTLGFFKGQQWARFVCYGLIGLAIYVGVVSFTGLSCPLTEAEYALRRLYDHSGSWIRSRSLLGTVLFNITGIDIPEFVFTIILIVGIGVTIGALVTRRV